MRSREGTQGKQRVGDMTAIEHDTVSDIRGLEFAARIRGREMTCWLDSEEQDERTDDARAQRARSAVTVEVAVIDARLVDRDIVLAEAPQDEHHDEEDESGATQGCIDEHLHSR